MPVQFPPNKPPSSSPPRVEGVGVVMYVAKGLDLNAIGKRVGGYTSGMGPTTHDVFDVDVSQLHPFVADHIPDTIAGSADGKTIRLYVPTSERGRINDIAILNGLYTAPQAPYVPRDGGAVFCAPTDEAKYRNYALSETRPKTVPSQQWSTQWTPGPGNRFHVDEID